MSLDPKPDPLPHIRALADAVRAPGQPEATFRALDAAMGAAIGHKLFTVLIYHAGAKQTERFYTNHPAEYPVGGRKEVRPTAWTERLLIGQQVYIANDIDEIAKYFLDHELIRSLGCESVMNVPVVWNGVTLGTANLLHEASWYDPADTEIAMTIASLAAPAYLHVAGAN